MSFLSQAASLFPTTLRNFTDHDINQFQFIDGVTPLSTWHTPVIAVISYLSILYLCKWIVSVRGKPFDLNWFVIFHNSLLVILSGIAFIALATELLHLINKHGIFTVYCDVQGILTVGPIVFYYYINYLYKFYELIDTFLLGLRGKPTPFLHVYHHAATLVLCWSQLRAQSCVQWIPIVINLFVHVVMYSYYTLHALGIDVWWKRYLTQLQIIQFCVGILGCFGGFTPLVLHDAGVAWAPKCWGRYPESVFGIFVLLSYLALFIQLYRNIYAKKGAAKKQHDKQQTNGHTKKEL